MGGGKKMEDPHALKSNEMAECSFQPQQPLVADTFKNCEGLSRVAFMDGHGVVMLGKVITCEQGAAEKDAGKAGGKKKCCALVMTHVNPVQRHHNFDDNGDSLTMRRQQGERRATRRITPDDLFVQFCIRHSEFHCRS